MTDNQEMVKVKRGNWLSDLWEEIFLGKMRTLKREPLPYYGPVEQRINPDRQKKLAVMREQGITGKQYRRRLKLQRRLAKEAV
jgi:hypothetical protein